MKNTDSNSPHQSLDYTSISQDTQENLRAFEPFQEINDIATITQALQWDIQYFHQKIQQQLSENDVRVEFSVDEMKQINHAYIFAAIAHRWQTRSDDISPYHQHLIRVALISAQKHSEQGNKKIIESICKALLHDTLEDATHGDMRIYHLYIDYIRQNFWNEVYNSVLHLTKLNINEYKEKNGHLDLKDKALAKEKMNKDYLENQIPPADRIFKISDHQDFWSSCEHFPADKLAKKLETYSRYIVEWIQYPETKIDCIALLILIHGVCKRKWVHSKLLEEYPLKKYRFKERDAAYQTAKSVWKTARTAHVSQTISQTGHVTPLQKPQLLWKIKYKFQQRVDHKLNLAA